MDSNWKKTAAAEGPFRAGFLRFAQVIRQNCIQSVVLSSFFLKAVVLAYVVHSTYSDLNDTTNEHIRMARMKLKGWNTSWHGQF